MATITLQGNEINTNGELPKVGDNAPDFTLVNAELGDVSLATYKGKKKLLSIVPSLDTPVCATSTKKFNDAAKEKSDAVFLMIAADLPFAMSRFCKAEGTDNVITLSMMRSRKFCQRLWRVDRRWSISGYYSKSPYRCLMRMTRLFISELVPEIAQEPNYDAALAIFII